jgi:hypothetical protein
MNDELSNESIDMYLDKFPYEKLPELTKNAVNEINTTTETKSTTIQELPLETEKKLYLLAFMPINEMQGLVLGELGESLDLDRMKKLWLPKTKNVQELIKNEPRIVDDVKMNEIVKDIDPKYSEKIQQIEDQLKNNPFWRTNNHSIKMVKIDELITLQGEVNLNRAQKLAENITKNSDVGELLDYTIPMNRKSETINHHRISNTGFIFSTKNHDVRVGKIEVRQMPQYNENEAKSEQKVTALVIPIVEGEPILYCLRTYNQIITPEGKQQKNYYIRLQNGIHRAYALRSLGVE